MAATTPRKKKPAFSVANLEREASAEPFVYTNKNGDEVVFCSPSELDIESAQVLMSMGEATDVVAALQAWLGEEDYAALMVDKLTVGQVSQLIEAVTEHYADFLEA